MTNCVLAVDIGASSGRHIVGWIAENEIRTHEVYRFTNGMHEKNGHLCWDVDALVQHVIQGLRAAHDQGFLPMSIGIDTWGVDFVLLDHEGRVVGDVVAYRDQRTEGMDEILEQQLSFDKHYHITGIAKQTYNSVYQMMAVLKEHPEYRVKAADFLFIPEYIAYALTGKKGHEWTECSTSALCNARRHTWAAEVVAAANLPASWFSSSILEPGTALGNLKQSIAEQVGFQTTVVFPASHDTGSAYMAIPARTKNAAFLSSGTWSLLGMEVEQPILSDSALIHGFTNEGGYEGSTRFLKNIMGMWILQCIHKEINASMTYEEMAQAAVHSKYSGYIDATNSRYLAPRNMIDEVLADLSEQKVCPPQEIGDIIRAVTYGLAVCYRDAVAEISQITGKQIDSINIVGGGSRNSTLNQMTANLIGLPVYAGPVESTALGNIGAQMIRCGWITSLNEFRNSIASDSEMRTFLPDADSSE